MSGMPACSTRVERLVEATPYWLRTAGVPGLQLALIQDARTCGVYSFGTTAPGGGAPVMETTIFKAASLSKQLLLYAALQAVDAGKLDLDRPLAEYLNAPYDADDPDIARITARHVLTHTAGWPNWPPDGERIRRASPLGSCWTYSGQGFLYLQTALEAIWAEPAADYLERLVLGPLGMPRSSFLWRDEYKETAVEGYDTHGDIREVCRWYPTEVDSASSLHTTAYEYARVLEAFLAQDLRERHPDVYRSHVALDERLGWGLGWGIADDRILWQWGYHVAFNAFAALDPDRGLGIVCLTNGARGQRINREWVNAWLQTDLPAFYHKTIEL